MGNAGLLGGRAGDTLRSEGGDKWEVAVLQGGLDVVLVLHTPHHDVRVTALLHELSHEAVAHLGRVELARHPVQAHHAGTVSGKPNNLVHYYFLFVFIV